MQRVCGMQHSIGNVRHLERYNGRGEVREGGSWNIFTRLGYVARATQQLLGATSLWGNLSWQNYHQTCTCTARSLARWLAGCRVLMGLSCRCWQWLLYVWMWHQNRARATCQPATAVSCLQLWHIAYTHTHIHTQTHTRRIIRHR